MSHSSSVNVSLTSESSRALSLREHAQCLFELTRLHKFPLGNILVIWPCLWALVMSSYKEPRHAQSLAWQTVLFAIGSTLLHSAACVINDICDIEFDRHVDRCKNRPLVTGAISLPTAWILLAALVAACLYILSFANATAAFVGLFGIFPFHALYPLMKRWTWWPQAWLGIAMNWGFPVAWLSIRPTVDSSDARLLYVMMAGLICWTIVYDTEYGCQDKKDDIRIGVKSTALLFGDYVRPILTAFATAFIACLIVAGLINDQKAVYFVVSCGGAASHLAWQLLTWKTYSPTDCGAKFKSHQELGAIVWAGIVLDYGIRHR